MQKSPDFVGQDRAGSTFDNFVGQLLVYRTTNVGAVYNER